MKHNSKIIFILLFLFLITQLIGLFVVSFYNSSENKLPLGMEANYQEIPKEISFNSFFFNILFPIIFVFLLFFILTKTKAKKFIKIWFFIVTGIAISVTLNVGFVKLIGLNLGILLLVISLIISYFKIFKRNLILHNSLELLIYPGIAAIFTPILGIFSIIILLLIISFYDIWAVWHSKIMQKMAKYQINKLKIFTGFFVPYISKKDREKIKRLKEKYKEKSKSFLEKKLKKSKIKANLAILGGGDIVLPIICSGVFYREFGWIPALIIVLFSGLSLFGLFTISKKQKFYPAMPFLTIGIYLGIILIFILNSLKIL